MVCSVAAPGLVWAGKQNESRNCWLAILQIAIEDIDREASAASVRLLRILEDRIARVAQRGLPEPGIARRDVEVALLVGERGRIRCWVAAAVAGRPERVGTNAVLRFRLESVASQVGDAGANVS